MVAYLTCSQCYDKIIKGDEIRKRHYSSETGRHSLGYGYGGDTYRKGKGESYVISIWCDKKNKFDNFWSQEWDNLLSRQTSRISSAKALLKRKNEKLFKIIIWTCGGLSLLNYWLHQEHSLEYSKLWILIVTIWLIGTCVFYYLKQTYEQEEKHDLKVAERENKDDLMNYKREKEKDWQKLLRSITKHKGN